MTYWTIMWVTILGGPYDGQGSFIAYPTLASCEAALAVVGDTLPYDHNMLCEETTVASSSLRPKPNPFY